MIQYSRFFDGGYVLHKITGDWSGRVSAWFRADGTLYEAEQLVKSSRFSGRPVKRGGPMWREVQRVGLRYLGRGAT